MIFNTLKLPMKEVIFFQCAIFCIILALALISGGIPSAVNAGDIQKEYIDPNEAYCDQDDLTDRDKEICNNALVIRNAQAASAVSSIT